MPIIIFILLMLFSPLTYAETCVNDYGGNSSCAEDAEHTTAGDCATLGYTATNCNGQAFLRCPFDESKLRCIEHKVEEAKIDFSTLKDWSTQKPNCKSPKDGSKYEPLTYEQDGKTYYRCVFPDELTCADFFSDMDNNDYLCSEVASCKVCDEKGNNCRTVSRCKKFNSPNEFVRPYIYRYHYDFNNSKIDDCGEICGNIAGDYVRFKYRGYEKYLDFFEKTYKDIVGVDVFKDCSDQIKEECDSKCSKDETYCKVCEEIEKEFK